MFSATSVTSPASIRTRIAPSPSTRASVAVLIVLVRRSVTVGTRLGERLGARVEGMEEPVDRRLGFFELAHLATQSRHVRRLHRPEAAVTAAVIGRADRTATGVRDRSEARRAVRHGHADGTAALALGADAGRGDLGATPDQLRADHPTPLVPDR